MNATTRTSSSARRLDARRAILRGLLPCLLLGAASAFSTLPAMAQEMPFAQWPELQKGHAPDAVFQIENLDSVNLLNGNLTLTIPLGQSYPVSSSLSYGLTLVYNSNPWEALEDSLHICDVNPPQGSPGQAKFYPKTLDRLSNVGVGWMINLGRFEPPGWEYYEVKKPDYVYVAPDGSRHGLHPELHYQGPEPTETNGIYHSRDGSFLRMIEHASCSGSGDCRRLELPDGSYQEFHHVGAEAGDYRPTLISDAFGNRVSISYSAHKWTITDDHGRRQEVAFDLSTPPYSYSKVASVTLSAFGGKDATYEFYYSAPVSIARHQYADTIANVSCVGTIHPKPGHPLLEDVVDNVEFLERIELPDGSFYGMTYDDEDIGDESILVDGLKSGEKSGAIHELRLASGLYYRWHYGFNYGRLKPTTDPRVPAKPVEQVYGVARKQRFSLDESGLEQDVVTWEYNHSKADIRGDADPPATSQTPFIPCYRQTDVRFFPVDRWIDSTTPPLRHSRHYFSSAENGPVGTSFKNRKSLPFTACPPEGGGVYYSDPSTPWYNDGLFLSQETLDPTDPEGPAIRSVWVDYETDGPDYADDKDGDRRVIRRRTVFHDDGGRWIETRYADFDGLGHFRRQVRRSNFEGTGGEKTDVSAYNMEAAGGSPSGPDFTPDTGSRWLLNTYSETCTHQGSGFQSCEDAQQRAFYDFDPATGFLRAMRQLRGSDPAGTDVLTTYDHYSDGNVKSERLYGGDPEYQDEPQLDPDVPFSPGSAPLDHRAEHAYSHGVRSRSVIYDGSTPLLETLDRTIDRNTGLASHSRDAADLETRLDFDRMSRLTKLEVRKNGQLANIATQLYRYTVPTEDHPDLTFPQVIDFCEAGSCRKTPLGLAFEVRDCPPGTADYDACHGEQLGERRFFYDRQGRLVDERRLVPWTGEGQPCHVDADVDGEDTCKEVLRKSSWDLADRKAWETEWHPPGLGFRVFYTSYPEYDLLDRPLAVERPDLKQTTFTYQGERLTTRTVGVWTVDGETPSTTTEQRDGFGRLIRVTEPAGAGDADVHTTYSYDQGDRLVLACVGDGNVDALDGCTGQARRFAYDGAGLITEEQHPEIEEPVRFTYDARGNVLEKDLDGTAHDLRYVYDAAGRAIEVYDGDGYLFQESFYGRSNDGPRRVGKLYQTRRHNWLPESPGSDTLVDHVVTETYDHSAPGDLLASYSVRSSRGASFTTRYTYDTLGSLTSLDYPDCDRAPCSDLDGGPTLAMKNVLGRVVEIPGWLDKVRYRARGTLSRIEHANGLTDEIQRHFTLWKPIEKILVRREDLSVLWDTGSFEYDGAGNIYRIGQESFTYDLVSRLRSATVATAFGTATESQTYDVFGNIVSITRAGEDTTRQLSPSGATNRLPASLASYDAGGNLTSWAEDGRTYTYEYAPDNRATTLEGSQGQSRAFLYTASGERFAVFDRVTGEEIYTPRGPGDGLLSRFERGESGWQRTKDYVRVDGKAVATVADGVVRHLHQDHLGSTRFITDAAGDVVGDRTTFFPFGTYAHDGTPGGEEHRFTGHERDDVGLATAGLDYMHARYYASSIGRFLSVDPVLGNAGAPQSWNRYTYVQNNPIWLVDQDGRDGAPPPYYHTSEGLRPRGTGQVLNGGGKVGGSPQGYRVLSAAPRLARLARLVRVARLGPIGVLTYLALRNTGSTDNIGVRMDSPAEDSDPTRRPSGFRKRTVQDAWDNAPLGSSPGTRSCPTCGKDVEVAPGTGNRDWDIDHQPPWSQRDLEGKTREEVLDEYNRGTRLECPSCNRSRGAHPCQDSECQFPRQ